jgi:hypothetical protein
MKAGPKAAVDESSLPFRPRTKGAARVRGFDPLAHPSPYPQQEAG